jgi:hypothetical protein
VVVGSTSLYEYYNKKKCNQQCNLIVKTLLGHADVVYIGDNYIHWKVNNIIYIVGIASASPCAAAMTIMKWWRKGTNCVLTSVDSTAKITVDFVRELERSKVPDTEDDRDTIMIMRYNDIGNAVTPSNLADGYYGIFANKFNIIHTNVTTP